MEAKIKYSGNIFGDILEINHLTEKEYEKANRDEYTYVPSNLKALRTFINTHDKIVAVTDCDADGLSAAGVLRAYNDEISILYSDRITDRGFSTEMLSQVLAFYGDEKSLGIITLDTGITAADTVRLAQSFNVDVFITDHHQPDKELPNCEIINPWLEKNIAFQDLCGAGVIYAALRNLFGDNVDAKQYAAIGTICDVVPLLYDNRYLVRSTLRDISYSPSNNIANVIKGLGINIHSETDIGFYLGPALNAASRLNKTHVASESYVEGKSEFVPELSELNKLRKKVTKEAIKNAKITHLPHVIIAELKENRAAILGLVAIKLAKEYNKVAVVCSRSGYEYTCSMRTLDIIDASDFIKNSPTVKGGGHYAAAGYVVSTRDFESFQAELNDYISFNKRSIDVVLQPDIELDIVNAIGLYDEMKKYAPFGAGFKAPVFLQKGVVVDSDYVSYTANNHLKFVYNGITGYYYNPPVNVKAIYDEPVDLAYEIDYNVFTKRNYIKVIGAF